VKIIVIVICSNEVTAQDPDSVAAYFRSYRRIRGSSSVSNRANLGDGIVIQTCFLVFPILQLMPSDMNNILSLLKYKILCLFESERHVYLSLLLDITPLLRTNNLFLFLESMCLQEVIKTE
jgi:hypothetical protein